VVNLSSKTLSSLEINLLAKGLSFCPSTKPPQSYEVLTDYYRFDRKACLSHHFRKYTDTKEYQQNAQNLVPKKDTGWTPNAGLNPNLDTFLNHVKERITNHDYTPKGKHNLTMEERQSLKNLGTYEDIIIKPADKGGAIVIMDKTDYIKKAMELLDNKNHYRRVYKDFTDDYTTQISDYIKKQVQQNKINKEVAAYITPQQPRTPTFYILPKIHKKGNPGRPIVSAIIDSPTDKISRYLDNIIRPLVPKIPSYIKDTTHILQKLKDINHIPSTAILVTMDVSALYTNIPHKEGVTASINAISRTTRLNHIPPLDTISYLMRLTLERNCFDFNNKKYIQVSGTAMGTAMAPSYANLFMHELETKMMATSTFSPYRWYRYIDDILIIWCNNQESLDQFTEYVNQYHPTIKFTKEQSMDEIPFLDLYVQIRNNHITTRTYHKPTDAHNYLHYSSNHPNHQKKGIPYSQFLRMVRNCTRKEDAEHSINMLLNKFLQRGYPRRILHEQKTKALALTQSTLLLPKVSPEDKKDPLIYITTHNPHAPRIKPILEEHKPGLQNHPHTVHMDQFIVAFRRPRNLKDMLVHSSMLPKEAPGTYKCGKCTMCTHVQEGNSFKDSNNRIYRTRGHISCDTKYVIYLLSCRKCQVHYVGQTSKDIKTRVYQHLGDIRRKEKKKTVATHFNLPGHNLRDVSITGIGLASRSTSERLLQEKAWIVTLRTMQPWGLNVQNA
jgi:hypothetical protein